MSRTIKIEMTFSDEQYRQLIRLAARAQEQRAQEWERLFPGQAYSNSVDDYIQVAIKEVVLAAIGVQL